MRIEIAWRGVLLLTGPIALLLLLSGAAAQIHEPQAGASLTPWFALATMLFLLAVGLLAFRVHSRRR